MNSHRNLHPKVITHYLPWSNAIIAIGLVLASSQPSPANAVALPPTVQTTLPQLVEQAVRTHPSVLAKLAELRGSKTNVDSAKWQYYPSLSVQSERWANQSNRTLPTTATSLIRLQQNLWSGGRLDAGARNAEFKLQAAYHAWQETRYSVALRTVEAWQDWLIALGRQEAAVKLLGHLERLSSMMDRRVEQQVSPAIDSQLLRARFAQAQSERLKAKVALEAARQRLMQWTGDDVLVALQFTEQVALPPWPIDTAQRVEAAAQRAPIALRLEADISAAQQELRQKQSEQWPSVYARLDRQFYDNAVGFGKTVENTVYVGFQYTLGAGLSVYAQVETVQAKVQSLQNEREALLRQLKETYNSEWRDYQSVIERIDYAQSVSNNTTTLSESYTRLFVAGRRSWLELLNTLREESSADQTLTDLQAQQQGSYFRLQLYLSELSWQANSTP
jgi:outer membrane protein, adhesin transport system